MNKVYRVVKKYKVCYTLQSNFSELTTLFRVIFSELTTDDSLNFYPYAHHAF